MYVPRGLSCGLFSTLRMRCFFLCEIYFILLRRFNLEQQRSKFRIYRWESSFSIRAAVTWNKLPHNVIGAPSVSVLQRGVFRVKPSVSSAIAVKCHVLLAVTRVTFPQFSESVFL